MAKKKGNKPVSASEFAKAVKDVRVAEQAYEQLRAQAQATVQKAGTRLQATRNHLDELTQRHEEVCDKPQP